MRRDVFGNKRDRSFEQKLMLVFRGSSGEWMMDSGLS